MPIGSKKTNIAISLLVGLFSLLSMWACTRVKYVTIVQGVDSKTLSAANGTQMPFIFELLEKGGPTIQTTLMAP